MFLVFISPFIPVFLFVNSSQFVKMLTVDLLKFGQQTRYQDKSYAHGSKVLSVFGFNLMMASLNRFKNLK